MTIVDFLSHPDETTFTSQSSPWLPSARARRIEDLMSETTTAPPARQPVLGLPDPGERVPQLAGPTVALWVSTLALFGVEAYGVLAGDWTRWATIPMGAAVTFLMFSVLHEATHHAVSTNTRLN